MWMNKSRDDSDTLETKEWLDALSSLVKYEGKERAKFILQKLLEEAQKQGIESGISPLVTPYHNTISLEQEPQYPGDFQVEGEIEGIIRLNAIAMVLNAKKNAGGVGGHLSSFASIATLYEVGLNHFFRGQTKENRGDLIYF